MRKPRQQVTWIRALMVPLDPPRQSFSQRFEAPVKKEKELLEDLTGTLHEKYHENNEKRHSLDAETGLARAV
jgi:hypothetical protein